jgi:transposase
MKRINNKKVTFKEYRMNQQFLLPPSLDELIPTNHQVRVVERAIERMNIEPLLKQYKGGGRSNFHPKMMLKVLVYAYSQKIYSSRMIAKSLRENINFMWIAGNNRPDFRTINRFRSSVMKEVIDEIFTSVIELLIEEKYVNLENYFLDGTKIEANANKYSWVWAKSTQKNHAKLKEKIQELLATIEETNRKENEQYGDLDLEELGEHEINAEKLEQTVKELDARLKKDSLNKELGHAVKQLEEDYLPRKKKYEEQESKLNGRNSYSKTDEDATFMRMKEDPMKNGQLKPGYNIQIGTEGQFIVGYTVHQKPGDSTCLIPHLEHVRKLLNKLPQNIIADSGYGSEENYEYLLDKGLGNYVKFNNFHLEQTRKFKQDAFRVENLAYDAETDEFICPAGKRLKYLKTQKMTTENGYSTERRIYEAEECQDCPLKGQCTKADGNRKIQVSFRLNQLKETARNNLKSDHGKELRSQRAIEVESVFGRIKNNWGFRRFLLRSLDKVKVEWGLLSIAHNLVKMGVSPVR